MVDYITVTKQQLSWIAFHHMIESRLDEVRKVLIIWPF